MKRIKFNYFSDPWVGRKKKSKKNKKTVKKRQSTQDKIDSILLSHKAARKGHEMSQGDPIPPPRDAIERACTMKENLLSKIEGLGDRLPPNTLDQLIDELGGPENVAEVSVLLYQSSYRLIKISHFVV